MKWICFKYLLTPLGTRNLRIGTELSFVGITRVYVFGLLVAEIQKTAPWEQVEKAPPQQGPMLQGRPQE